MVEWRLAEEGKRMSEQQGYDSPLVGERGSTNISDSVVATIAGRAAQEVEGVHMGGSASRRPPVPKWSGLSRAFLIPSSGPGGCTATCRSAPAT